MINEWIQIWSNLRPSPLSLSLYSTFKVISVLIFIYIERDRDRERETERDYVYIYIYIYILYIICACISKLGQTFFNNLAIKMFRYY